jgi:hypothetical protein
MSHRGRRDRRDWVSFRHAPGGGTGATVGAVTAVTVATASPLGFASAAVTTATVELWPARTLIWWDEGLRCRRERHDRVTVVSDTHFAPWPKVAAALNQKF